MSRLRIGLVYQGNDTDDIWGCSITTYHLAEEFKRLGHDVWRLSVSYDQDLTSILSKKTDILISEGTPEWLIKDSIWENSRIKIFWWLSELYYNQQNIQKTKFDGIVTNSISLLSYLKEKNILCRQINLCAFEKIARAPISKNIYSNYSIYLGNYPHKEPKQMSLLFEPAIAFNFGLYGNGWEKSPYKLYYNGRLPLNKLGSLYRSSPVILLLTEKRQKEKGMFNNRMYEALASGRILISEAYDFLEQSEFGEFIHFSNQKIQTTEILKQTSKDKKMKQLAEKAKKYILKNHTYKQRAKDFIEFSKEFFNV